MGYNCNTILCQILHYSLQFSHQKVALAIVIAMVKVSSVCSEEELTGLKFCKGSLQKPFSEKVGHLAQLASPPLPVSWAAKKRKKSLMFILHFRLF